MPSLASAASILASPAKRVAIKFLEYDEPLHSFLQSELHHKGEVVALPHVRQAWKTYLQKRIKVKGGVKYRSIVGKYLGIITLNRIIRVLSATDKCRDAHLR